MSLVGFARGDNCDVRRRRARGVGVTARGGVRERVAVIAGLIHGVETAGVATAIAMPVAVAAVALTAGVAVATFVKAFGIGFLAKPRTPEAQRAVESRPEMITAMITAAALCAGLALASGLIVPKLAPAVGAAGSLLSEPATDGALTMRLEGVAGSLSPVLITSALLIATVGVLALMRLASVARARRAEKRLWDCGAGPLSSRMEYTATSFAEPLQRVFDDVLEPELDV